MNERMTVELLRVTYNSLAKKRDPSLNRGYYDVFGSSQRGNRVKKSFENLAKKLIARQIDPVKYVRTMCIYGQYQNSEMPWPSFLCSKKALERFDWLYSKERRKYQNEVDMLRNLPVGITTNRETILKQVQEDHNYYWFENPKASEQDKRAVEGVLLIRFAKETSISPWYLALSDKLAECFILLSEREQKRIKQCRAYYDRNPKLKAKALRIFLSAKQA